MTQVVRTTVSAILRQSTEFSWERDSMLNLFHNFVMISRLVSVTVLIVHDLIWADLNNYANSRKVNPITVMIDN
jgi:hypothetical protein